MDFFSNMRMRPKLISLFLMAALIPALAIGWWAAHLSEQALVEKSFDQLRSAQNIKSQQVATYFAQRQNELTVFTTNPYFTEAFNKFSRAYMGAGGSESGKIKGLGKGEFESPNSYKSINRRYNQAIVDFANNNGYDDIIFLSDDGEICYTMQKGNDLATKVTDHQSSLQVVWNLAKNSKDAVVSDVAPYAPAANEPSQFVAMPVFSRDQLLGVVAVKLKQERLTTIMQQREGLGETGEAYLVGSDFRMRSDSFRDAANRSVSASFEGTVEDNGVQTKAVKEALAGNSGAEIHPDFNGQLALTVYAPVSVGDNQWVLVADISNDEVKAPVNEMYISVAIAIAILCVIAVLMAIVIAGGITKPLEEVQKYARKVATGDLSQDSLSCKMGGELGELSDDICAMVGELKERLGFAQGVLTSIPIASFTTDRDDIITFVNEPMLKHVDREGKPEDYVGMQVGEFIYGEKRETYSTKAIREKQTVDKEGPMTTLKGTVRTSRVVATPLYDLDGILIGCIELIVDLTELRQQQDAMERKNAVIEQAASEADAISEQVSSAAEQLSAQIDQSTNGTEIQRERTAEANTAIEEMNATTLEVAQSASKAAEQATEAQETATHGSKVVEQVVASITEVQNKTETLKATLSELGVQAEGIGAIMGVISDIADQTNLLALNAAIEAARAGEAGRGFAVVADEVRKLAEKTMNATREVGSAVSSIQEGTRLNIREMDEAAVSVSRTTELAGEAGEALQQIVHIVELTGDNVRSIATAAEEQSATSEEISRASEEVNIIAGETAAAMTESAQAVVSLSNLAQELRTIIRNMQNA